MQKISECAAKGGECDENKGRPVCGTDNQTYPTRCHLIRAQCSGHQVSLRHRGACKDACLASRAYSLDQRRLGQREIFVPKCRSDGSYAPIQCMDKSVCWCVTSQGKPIGNTTTNNGRPDCGKRPKSKQRRLSPRNPDNVRVKRVCVKSERLQFNENVVNIFQNEFLKRARHGMEKNQTNEKLIVNWKFGILDTNKNRNLEKQEYKELKRIIRKVSKSKQAYEGTKLCAHDDDDDEMILMCKHNFIPFFDENQIKFKY